MRVGRVFFTMVLQEGPGRLDAPGRSWGALILDQANVSGAWTFRGFLDLEIDALPFAQQLEHGAAHRAAMEEMLDTSFVADEAEALIDEKSSDSTRRHTRILRRTAPGWIPGEQAERGNGPGGCGP